MSGSVRDDEDICTVHVNLVACGTELLKLF